MKPHTSFAGFLSFFLPGTGQLYVHKRGYALLAFAGFIVFLQLSYTRVMVPLYAIACSVHAYWVAYRQEEQSRDRKREFTFSVVAVFAGFAWISLMVSFFSPVGVAMEMQDRSEKLAGWLTSCSKTQADCPGKTPNEFKFDRWNRPFDILGETHTWTIRSAGPDGKWQTEDDMVYRFRKAATEGISSSKPRE